MERGGDTEWLGFYKNTGNYVDISYLNSILKFKFAKKGKYLIVEKESVKKHDYVTEPCTKSEGGSDCIRVYFTNPFELEPLAPYFYKLYKKCRKPAIEYLSNHKKFKEEYMHSNAMINQLSNCDVLDLLESAEKRSMNQNDEDVTEKLSDGEKKTGIDYIVDQTIHNDVLLENILSDKENKIEEEIDVVNNEKVVKTSKRAILQLTDEMMLIKRYDSIAQAVRETGVNSKSIRDAAKGIQKHAGGYVWKYDDKDQ